MGTHQEKLIYSRRDRDKIVPMIRYNGNACERTKRQLTQTLAVGIFALAALLLVTQGMLQDSIIREFKASPPHESQGAARVSHPDKPPSLRTTQATRALTSAHQHLDNPADASSNSVVDDCVLDRREVILGIGQSSGIPKVGSVAFPAPNATKQHIDALMALLKDPKKSTCWRKQRALVASKKSERRETFFYDLGSRSMDQTLGFLRAYPHASQRTLICYEANPKFNHVYSTFQEERKTRGPKLEYHNEAVGVEEGNLILSDQDVGSSIVREAGTKARSRAPGDAEVKVVDFSTKVAERLSPAAVETGTHVVIKMDIEKMEFAVLHRMLLSGSLLLVDELLLECHYNTNLPRARRDASQHIGLDDCRDLVDALNNAMGGRKKDGEEANFEAVLWNSVKTARGSGYSERHGGFKPS
jgi:FkbM family methyltransferase